MPSSLRPKTVLFIQGGGAGAHREDALLVESLKSALGDGYQVDYPLMPNEDDPDYETWKSSLAQAISNEPAIVVAHSLGGYFVLKYLTEVEPNIDHLEALMLLSVPFPSGDPTWTFDGFELPANFGEKLADRMRTFIYHSPDDEFIDLNHSGLYKAALNNSVVRGLPGGHQLGNDLTAIAADIHGL